MFRSLFQFTIRDLFWLMLAVALLMGWMHSTGRRVGEAYKWKSLAGAIEEFLIKDGFDVEWRYDRVRLKRPDGSRVDVKTGANPSLIHYEDHPQPP